MRYSLLGLKPLPLPKWFKVVQKLLFLGFSVGVLAQSTTLVTDSLDINIPQIQEFKQGFADTIAQKTAEPKITITDYL
ncbi:MAG: hypothetical protein ACON5F_04735, partial [Jejuia sp.]